MSLTLVLSMGRKKKTSLLRIANAEAARSAKTLKRQKSLEAESNLCDRDAEGHSDFDVVVRLQSNL